jgi:uncharacterized membrane protein YgcG
MATISMSLMKLRSLSYKAEKEACFFWPMKCWTKYFLVWDASGTLMLPILLIRRSGIVSGMRREADGTSGGSTGGGSTGGGGDASSLEVDLTCFTRGSLVEMDDGSLVPGELSGR